MTVLNVAFTKVRNAAKMQDYIAAAAPLMQEYGAEVVVRGRYVKSLLGDDLDAHILGVFRFPDMATAKAFYTCERYLDLIETRDAAGDMTFNFYEE